MLAFGYLYLETATNIVIALDPETGVQKWRYDPKIDRNRRYSDVAARGVSVWEDTDPKHQGACTTPRLRWNAGCPIDCFGRGLRPAMRRLRDDWTGRSHRQRANSRPQ